MAVELTETSANFTGTGVSATYAAPIYANDDDQIAVYVDDVLQTIGDDYVLNGLGSASGISIVATFPLNAKIYVERDTPIKQPVDTQNNETILEDVLDLALDRLTLMMQERAGETSRALLVDRGESGLRVPNRATRAGRVLGFGADPDTLLALLAGGADSALRTDLASSLGALLTGFLADGTGAQIASVAAVLKGLGVFAKESFGVKADGVTDDTVAMNRAIAATPAGGTLVLPRGVIRISGSLVFVQPINMIGGTKEQTVFLCSRLGSYVNIGDGSKTVMTTLHSSSVLPGYPVPPATIDARRSRFEGFTIMMDPPAVTAADRTAYGPRAEGYRTKQSGPANLRGLVIATPMDVVNVDVKFMPGDGMAIIAGAEQPLKGNANGTRVVNCICQWNGGSGFVTQGTDANACAIDDIKCPANFDWGIYENGFLGNLYKQPEVDANGQGIFVTSASDNRTVILFPYVETGAYPQNMLLNPRCQVVGVSAAGSELIVGGIIHDGLPSNELFLKCEGLVLADNRDVANSRGDGPAGRMLHVGKDGIDYRATATALHVKLSGLLSPNYTDIVVGTNAAIRFPNSAFTGNVDPKRPFLPEGFTFGASGVLAIVGESNGAGGLPAAASLPAGAIIFNTNIAAGQPIAWTNAGTAWRPWPNYA